MKSVEEKPTKHTFPKNLKNGSKQCKLQYFDVVLHKFMDQYLLQKNPNVGVDIQDDHVKNYAGEGVKVIIWRTTWFKR